MRLGITGWLLTYYLVCRICKGGELFDEIISRGKFSEKDAAVLMKQILQCVNYCHSNHIVHRYVGPNHHPSLKKDRAPNS